MYRFFTLAFCMLGATLIAQKATFLDHFHPEFQVGIIAGTPYGALPSNVVEFSGEPSVAPFFSGLLHYQINSTIALSTGVSYTRKGNNFSTIAEDEYDVTDGIFGENFPLPLHVDYRAYVHGGFDNKYIDIPIYASIRWKKMQLLAGYQYSNLRKRHYAGSIRVDVDVPLMEDQRMLFDDAYLLKKHDHAALLGISFDVFNNWRITSRASYSLIPIFSELPEGMEDNMRNIYMIFAVGYVF